MLRRVIIRTNVSEECSRSVIRVTRIGEQESKLTVTTTVERSGKTVFLRRVCPLLVTANVVPGSPIFVTLNMEALYSSETSVITRVKRRNILEDGILHSHRRKNLKSY
jgi:hypothetical protein